MKPALFYVLGRRYGRTTLDSLMAVTSVKGGQLYGRDAVHGNPTHRRADDMVHAFRTLEDAQSVIKLAQEAYDAHQNAVDKAEALRHEAIRLQGEAVKRAGWDKTMTFPAVMEHLRQKSVVPGPGTVERLGRRMKASYFDGYHFAHIAAWDEQRRLARINKACATARGRKER